MRYCYYLYSFVLCTDIEFPMLIPYKGDIQAKELIFLHVNNNDINFNSGFVIDYLENISYSIMPDLNIIAVKTANLDYIYHSLLDYII